MLIRMIIAGTGALALATTAAAQGAFDFGDIPGVDGAPTVDVNLNQTMIGFARALVTESNPEAAELLAGLRGIRVRVYNSLDNTRQFNNFINDVTEELEDTGWQRVVFAEDGGSKVRMHMRMTEEAVSGLTVMVVDESEAIFLNIDGTITASDLGKLMAALPVQDVLGGLSLPAPGTLPPPPVAAPPVAPTPDAD